jgi:hypothetical protein
VGHKTNGRINVHHICAWNQYPELRYVPQNGCTVCIKCHKEIEKKPETWAEILNELLYSKYYGKAA